MIRRLTLIIALLFVFTGGIVYTYITFESQRAIKDAFADLDAIDALKGEHVNRWLSERAGDADALLNYEGVARRVFSFLSHPDGVDDFRLVKNTMESLHKSMGYANTMLLDVEGRLLIASGMAAPVSAEVRELMPKVISTKNVAHTDLYRTGHSEQVQMDWLVPLLDPSTDTHEVMAVMVLRVDPSRTLYPYLRAWPIPSATAESILVRRDGNDLLLISEVRNQAIPALTLRFPLSKPDLPGNYAVKLGKAGNVRAVDYRGHDVLSSFRPVGDGGWYLVSNMDYDEVMEPVWHSLYWIVGLCIAANAIIVLAVWFILRQQERLQRVEAEAATNRVRSQLHAVGENLGSGFVFQYCLSASGESRFNYVSASIRNLFGYTAEKLMVDARPLLRQIDRGYWPTFLAHSKRSAESLSAFRNQIPCAHPDGNIVWLDVHAIPHRAPNGSIVWDGLALDASDRRRATELLEASEERFRRLFDDTRQPMMLIENGIVTEVNHAALQMFRLGDRKQLIGRSLAVFSPEFQPDDAHSDSRLKEIFETAWRNGSNRVEWELVRSQDEHFMCEIFLTPITMGEHFVLYVLCTDISQRFRLQRELLRYQSIVESSDDAIISESLNGTIVSWNPGAERMYGYTADEMIGRTLSRLIPADHTGEDKDILEHVRQGKIIDLFETERVCKNGDRISISVSVSPIRDSNGVIIGATNIARDINERKRREEERANERQRLEIQVAQRTSELEKARRAAEAANQAKTTFLANMSHEIRTPMNAILGFTHLLELSVKDPVQLDKLNKISISSKHLLDLIDDVLDLSKIEADRLQLEAQPFHLEMTIDNVRSMMAERLEAKGLRLVEEIEPELLAVPMVGDSLRIGQMLINYLGNAVKFTEHGEVCLSGRIEEQTPEWIRVYFSVKDTGIGIDPAHQNRLFEAFEQAESSTTRNFGGSGLGLSITRRLAQLMNGEVGVHSTPGQGSTFWFRVKLPRGDSGQVCNILETRSRRRPRAGAKILLVEDNLLNREVACEILSSLGMQVDIAEHGGKAVERVAQAHYDLILMDMQMPVMDGLEASRRIKTMQNGSSVPVLAMTANAFVEDRMRCKDAGMVDFVAKPVEPKVLSQTLARWLPEAEGDLFVPESQDVMNQDLHHALDAAAGLAMAMNRPQLYQRMLRLFLADGQGVPARIEAAVIAGNFKEAEHITHTLKGMSGQIGANTLRNAAQALEEAIRDEDVSQLGDRQAAMARLLNHVIEAINVYLDENRLTGS